MKKKEELNIMVNIKMIEELKAKLEAKENQCFVIKEGEKSSFKFARVTSQSPCLNKNSNSIVQIQGNKKSVLLAEQKKPEKELKPYI